MRDINTPQLRYGDVYSLIRNATPGTAIYALESTKSWNLEQHLLARIEYHAAMAVWMRTEDAAKGRTSSQPKLIKCPCCEHDDEHKDAMPADALPVEQMIAFLAANTGREINY